MNGLGDAILHAREHVGDEPFAVLLGDTLMQPMNGMPVTRQLLDVFDRFGESVVALEEVPREKVSRYGIVSGSVVEDGVMLVSDFVEKPKPEEAPSNLAIASRYVFTPEIFGHLSKVKPGKNGEIQLTDALRRQLETRAVFGYQYDGIRYDIGNRLDYLMTQVEFGLRRPDLRTPFRAYLKCTLKDG